MLRIATVFSGIGAVEQALKQLHQPYKILFACDNGERYLKIPYEDVCKIIDGCTKEEREEKVRMLYDLTKKENLVKKSYIANYGDSLEDWYEDITESERNEGRARVNRSIIGCQTANQQFNWTGDFRIEVPEQRHYDDDRIYIGEFEGHPAVARKLTPRECLNLMGFDEFKIVVPDQVMYRQAGNSIAVPVLKCILKNILEALDGEMVY